MESKTLRVVEAAMKMICNHPVPSQSKSKVVERVTKVEKNEIDYDLLANAIIKAHKTINDVENKAQDGKKREKISVSATLFSSMAAIFLWILGIVLITVSIAIWVTKYEYLCEADWGKRFWTMRVLGDAFSRFDVPAICMFFFGVLSCASGNEIGNEHDRHYIVAVFSAVTSMAALMVALAALAK
jgi:hypothetical protein